MSAKNVVIVLGSPRKNGNSTALAQRVAEGAKEAGAEAKNVYLNGINIKPCTACDVCRRSVDIDCNITYDMYDMKSLYSRLRRADAMVIASPIYMFSIVGQTKVFIDRCYALLGRYGMGRQENDFKGKQFGIVFTYESTDSFISGAVNAIRPLQDMLAYFGALIVGLIYGRAAKAGEIKSNHDLMEKAYDLGKKLAAGV